LSEAALLDPLLLARLATLPLRARRVVEGVLTGLHRSRHQGQAVEFAEHKEYAPGDEIRHIDWRAYARIDKYYVKNYELETNLRAWVVLDASASMGYGRRPPGAARPPVTKLDYAKVLGAALAYLLVRQGDSAGLLVAGSPMTQTPAAGELSVAEPARDADGARLPPAVRRCLPPRSSAAHLAGLMDVLEKLRPAGATDLAGAVDFLAEKTHRRSSVFVLSDLFDPSPRALASLSRLRHRRCEVAVFHVLDPDELEFPFEDPTEFLGMEGPERLEAHPRSVREGYLEEIRAFLASTRRQLRDADIEYVSAPTGGAPDRLLLDFLFRRRAAAARRGRGG